MVWWNLKGFRVEIPHTPHAPSVGTNAQTRKLKFDNNMIETPSNGRAKIFKNGNSIEFQIPAKKNWFIIIFLTAWLGGWFMGETFAIGELFNSDTPVFANAFLLFWLTGWTVGGLFAITILLWSIAGQEIIKIENGILEIGRQIFSLKRIKKYQITELRHLSINPTADNDVWGMGYQRNLFGLKGGVLKFDYGLKTLKFGGGIDEAEGRLIIETLKLNPNFKETNFG